MSEEIMKLPSKADLVDTMGKPVTQSLFLEIGYSDLAVYTLKDDHYTYNGKLYPSLKKLFIEMGDPTEYSFANTYLLGWRHWKRLCENKIVRKHIDEWREELEVKLRCEGILAAIDQARGGTFQAAKWLADRGWDKRGAGRPSKEEMEREKEFLRKVDDGYSADIVRINRHVQSK